MKKVQLVNLSNLDESKLRNNSGVNAYYSEEYRGLDPTQRARKAALSVSNNGECWWVYAKVYSDLIYKYNYDRKKR